MATRSAAATLALVLCVGCGTPQGSARVNPTTRATPTVTAGDGTKILQELSQIQTTLSTVTSNYSLDAERAKLEAKRLRMQERREAGIMAFLIGIILICLAVDSPVHGYWRGIIITVGVSMAVGSVAIPMLWPF